MPQTGLASLTCRVAPAARWQRTVCADRAPRTEPGVKRLLTIGHSYVVAQNRRLAHEMAREGRGEWDVTAAVPARLRGDLRDIEIEPIVDEACAVAPLT